jgi:hypothetical protein
MGELPPPREPPREPPPREPPPREPPPPRSSGSEFSHRWQQLKASGALTTARDTHLSSAPSAGRTRGRNLVWLAVGAAAVVLALAILLFKAARP